MQNFEVAKEWFINEGEIGINLAGKKWLYRRWPRASAGSGKGLGVQLFQTEQGLADYLASEQYEQPLNKPQITHDYDQHPIIKQLVQCLANNGVEVAGIEIIADEAGLLYAYDINTNTNYNAQAEAEAAVVVTGMAAIAGFLAGLAESQ